MDFNKAIATLGLKSNFTEDEFKKAYRKLSLEYHPDKFEGTPQYEDMVKKQQEVNEAKDFIKDYLKTNPDNIDLTAYIEQKMKEIKDITTFEFTKYNEMFSDKFKHIVNRIGSIYISLALVLITIDRKNKTTIDNNFNKANQDIKEWFKKLKELYYKEKYIDENDVKERISYDCTLREFYDQLSNIKEKYSKEALVKKRLEEEIEKYKTYVGYERLALLVDVCIHNALYYIKQNNYQNIELEIDKMHQQILNEVFNEYYSIKKKISDLETIIDKISDEEVKGQYNKIRTEFDNRGSSFSDTEQDIKRLEEKIREIKELELKQAEYRINETAINQIYQSLITRYGEAIKTYNIVNESESIKKLSELLKQVLQTFIQGCYEFKNKEFFHQFNEISFKNISNDEKIIKTILQQLKPNKSNIYIKLTNQFVLDRSSFFLFDEENMMMYRVRDIVTKRKITMEEFEAEYVPLENFLDSSNFIGEYRNLIGKTVRYICINNKIILYFSNNQFHLTTEESFSRIASFMPNAPQDTTSFEPFKDKQHVCELIEKQVKEIVEEYKKKQSQTSNASSPNPKTYGDPHFNTDDGYYYDTLGNKIKR